MMIILGIDPAIRCTGYGVVEFQSANASQILDCGVIRNTSAMPHSECLRRISGGIRQLIGQFKPDAASIEDPFVGRNPRTAIILGMARGAILAALADNAVPAYSYSPRTAKKSAVGVGTASKKQIAFMMANEFNLNTEAIPPDATDALALALCHARLAVSPTLRELLPKRL
ncbi:MAG: crossover junction endodeoxyribonuclease RuvC [Victivallaceae bacterium]|nr:crossover junction endodeoxyribonuclease RuvC [Victivallaceae bacterium]